MNFELIKVAEMSKSHFRVCFIGEIENIDQGKILIKDETGKIEAFCEKEVKNGAYRVFCTNVEDGLKVEFLQPLKDVNQNLFKRIKEVYIGLEHV